MTHENIKNFIETLLKKTTLPFETVNIDERAGQTVFQIQTSTPSLFVGGRGEVVRALNHLVKRAFSSDEEDTRFLIDVNGSQTKKIDELKQTAKLLAERARSLKYNVEMTPMSSYERMIVHALFSEDPDVMTVSEGEGPHRHVVIKYRVGGGASREEYSL